MARGPRLAGRTIGRLARLRPETGKRRRGDRRSGAERGRRGAPPAQGRGRRKEEEKERKKGGRESRWSILPLRRSPPVREQLDAGCGSRAAGSPDPSLDRNPAVVELPHDPRTAALPLRLRLARSSPRWSQLRMRAKARILFGRASRSAREPRRGRLRWALSSNGDGRRERRRRTGERPG